MADGDPGSGIGGARLAEAGPAEARIDPCYAHAIRTMTAIREAAGARDTISLRTAVRFPSR